jgi:hypothetical protein
LQSQDIIKLKSTPIVYLSYKTLLYLGIQQLLNFLIFRLDQNLIFYFGNYYNENQYDIFLRQAIFLFKLPELIGAVAVGIAPLYLPYFKINLIKDKIKKRFYLYILAIIPVYSIIILFYCKVVWNYNQPLNINLLIFIFLHLFLMIPANIITFNFLLDKNSLTKLLRMQLVSIFSGSIIVTIIVVKTHTLQYIISIVPIQLFIFTIMGAYKLLKD